MGVWSSVFWTLCWWVLLRFVFWFEFDPQRGLGSAQPRRLQMGVVGSVVLRCAVPGAACGITDCSKVLQPKDLYMANLAVGGAKARQNQRLLATSLFTSSLWREAEPDQIAPNH